MPWHSSPPVGVSSEKLLADGMSIPPFHGRCRCTLVMAETVEISEVSIEDKVTQLQAKSSEYQREYDSLQQRIQDAVNSRDVKKYNELSALQRDVVSKWHDLEQELRAAKIEAAKQGVIFASGISDKLDKTHVQAIVDAVKSAPEDVRKVWNIFEGRMKIADVFSGSSYYSPREGSIHINIARDSTSSDRPAYSVIFHELGHLIDNKAVVSGEYSRKSQYGLFAMLKSEVDEYVSARLRQLKADAVNEGKSPAEVKKKDAYASVEKELCRLPMDSSMSVSDLFSGATVNKCRDNWEHSASYWRRDPELICQEFFAQVYSDSIVNPQGIETIKRYAPKSYAIFQRMLEDMAK